MSNEYTGLTHREANALMRSKIIAIAAETIAEARSMSPDEWSGRDVPYWSDSIAGAIYYVVQNRLRGGP
ncbi:hypothetical protein [Rhizobium sp. 11_C7_N12_5]|uniref:hypothetical protein n=1 Tax=Rhizobium sp. 11_C7_N12_5 TaxID=3240770 RepID=UPI003F201CB8